MICNTKILYKLIDAISDLVRHHGLHAAAKGDAVVFAGARPSICCPAPTGGLHKGLAIQFLYEADLIGAHFVADVGPTPPVIALDGADLTGLLLPNANLAWARFTVTDLSRADLPRELSDPRRSLRRRSDRR